MSGLSISSDLTRIQNAKSSLATSITNKGVTVPSGTKIDGFAALVDQISSGLVYETGTYKPTADIAHPSISFTGSHATRPFFVGIVDAEASIASTDSVQYWSIFSLVDFCNSVQVNSTSYRYARTTYGYKTSSGGSTSGDNISSLTGSGNSAMPFYLSNTEFNPYSGSTSRYFRSTRSYKWIAVWV